MTNYNERLDETVPTTQEERAIREIVEYQCKALVEEGYDFEPLIQAFAGHQKQEIAKARAKQAVTSLIKELVAEAKRESHKSGYIQAIADFSGYYMDASIPAQRNLIMPHIAIELTENYKYPQNLLKALEEV